MYSSAVRITPIRSIDGLNIYINMSTGLMYGISIFTLNLHIGRGAKGNLRNKNTHGFEEAIKNDNIS